MTAAIPEEAAVHFRDALRASRASALRDSEAFDEILFAIERIGQFLNPKAQGLKAYEPQLKKIAHRAFPADVERRLSPVLLTFDRLYALVRTARNSAVHTGAFARHLTTHSIELAIRIEDGLMAESDTVGDFMVRTVIVAEDWQPLSLVRQSMLTNSYSYLPIWIANGGEARWWLLSDQGLASFLRDPDGKPSRKDRLALTLREAVGSGKLTLLEPKVSAPSYPVPRALAESRGLPILVTGEEPRQLLGIATPFDLL